MGEGQFPVRQAVRRFSSQAGTQARPIVLLHQPQGDGLSPINPSPPLPAIGTGRPLTTYSLPNMRGNRTRCAIVVGHADHPVMAGWGGGVGGGGGGRPGPRCRGGGRTAAGRHTPARRWMGGGGGPSVAAGG